MEELTTERCTEITSSLIAGATGAIFKIIEALVLSVEGRRVPVIVFLDSGSNLNFIAYEVAQQLQL